MGPVNQQAGGGWVTPGNDAGDIILVPSEPAGDNKKKVILVIAAAVIAAIICLVVTILITNTYKTGGGSGAWKKFEDYANYLLAGAEDVEDEQDFSNSEILSSNTEFKFEEMALRSPENADEYWEELNKKYETALKAVKSGEAHDILVKQAGILEVYRRETRLAYTDEVKDALRKDMAESLLRELESAVDENDEMYEYYISMTGYVREAIKEYQLYNENGCVIDGIVNDECVEEMPDDAFNVEIRTGDALALVRAQVMMLDDTIRSNVELLFELLGGGSE